MQDPEAYPGAERHANSALTPGPCPAHRWHETLGKAQIVTRRMDDPSLCGPRHARQAPHPQHCAKHQPARFNWLKLFHARRIGRGAQSKRPALGPGAGCANPSPAGRTCTGLDFSPTAALPRSFFALVRRSDNQLLPSPLSAPRRASAPFRGTTVFHLKWTSLWGPGRDVGPPTHPCIAHRLQVRPRRNRFLPELTDSRDNRSHHAQVRGACHTNPLPIQSDLEGDYPGLVASHRFQPTRA